MDNTTAITAVILDDDLSATISFTQVCHTYNISEELLTEWLEHGLFNDINRPLEQMSFKPHMIRRIQSARRLQDDLGMNLPGVILALELRDELDRLREELTILRRHLNG